MGWPVMFSYELEVLVDVENDQFGDLGLSRARRIDYGYGRRPGPTPRLALLGGPRLLHQRTWRLTCPRPWSIQ